MTTDLKWTGERLVSEINNVHGTVEHLHRYALAFELCRGKRVLDIASGEGYGSNLLAQTAAFVCGVDISDEAVSHAIAKYQKSNLQFKIGSASQIPLANDEVDVVISFETLEHHDRHEEMMSEVKRVLKPDGCLLISSPEKAIYTARDPNNPYHIKELFLDQFKALLSEHFTYTRIYDQRFVFGSLINTLNKAKDNKFGLYSGDFSSIKPELEEDLFYNKPFFNLALASDTNLDSLLPDSSLFSGINVLNAIQYEYKSQLEKILSSRAYKLSVKISKVYNFLKPNKG